jgi:hypothetical protein
MLRFVFITLLLVGCQGPGRVEFIDGNCLIDGVSATRQEVESREADVSRRLIARQPWSALLTVLVVLLIGLSNLEKVRVIFATRHASGKGFAERVSAVLERHRPHPVRYFSMIVGALVLLLVAGGLYIYVDLDKRASERALGMLQFCHLALQTKEEQGVLAEQRTNLATIQSTAGDIRALVDKLPPEEQRKAQLIVDEMNSALGREGKLVNQYLQRSDETNRVLKEHTETLQRGLSSVEAGVLSLKSLPANLHDLHLAVQKVDDKLKLLDGKLQSDDGKLGALEASLKALAARPERACPACVCDGAHAHVERADGGARRP